MTLGERIRTLRLDRALTQQQLAARCGVSHALATKWEGGKATPPASAIAPLCDLLGVTADYLLGRTEEPAGPPLSRTQRELDGWVASAEEAVVVPPALGVTGVAPAGSLALLALLPQEEVEVGRPVPAAVLDDSGTPLAIGLVERGAPDAPLSFRRPPGRAGAIPDGRLCHILEVAIRRAPEIDPGAGRAEATEGPDQTQGRTAPSSAPGAVGTWPRPTDIYRQVELVAALAQVLDVSEQELAVLVEALRAERHPVTHLPGALPSGLVLQWGIDIRESALWDGLLKTHIRPLAALTSIPVDVLSALVLALFRMYDDLRPTDLMHQADAGRMMGVSREFIRSLIRRGILRAWEVDGKELVRMRDVGILASRREQGKTVEPAATAPGGLTRRPGPLRVIRRSGKGTRDAAGEP